MAAFLSLAKPGLTPPHAIFVAVAVASPSTLYLWYLGVMSLFTQKIRLSYLLRGFGSHRSELPWIKALYLFAFIIWASLICAAHDSWKGNLQLLQRSCKQEFLLSLSSSLIIDAFFVVQCALGCGWLQVSHFLSRRWRWSGQRRRVIGNADGYVVAFSFSFGCLTSPAVIPFLRVTAGAAHTSEPRNTVEPRPDLVTWTEELLASQWSPSLIDKYTTTSIIGILQLHVLPLPRSPLWADFPIVLILLLGLWKAELGTKPGINYASRTWGVLLVRAL
jgi:hypothetical protein